MNLLDGLKRKMAAHLVGLVWVAEYHFEHFDRNGKKIWEEKAFNSLAQEGGYLILDNVLRGDAGATTFYLRLFNDTPVKTDALADITGEPSTNGYAAQQILKDSSANGWPTLALDSGDYKATGKQVTFTASGGSWGPVTYCVLATSSDNSGKHIGFVALSQSRTLNDGETLKVTPSIKQT